jgi:hypothetical protein
MRLPAGDNDGDRFRDRIHWLGHPAFFTAVLVLAINDHMMKRQFAAWWTGKLSDFAGVAVLGVALAAVAGPRRGLPLAGGLFVVLKMVPGAAEVAAPWLGGVTRRDATDLIALTVLAPLGFALTWTRGEAESQVARPTGQPISWAGLRAAMATSLPLVGIIFAVGASTATSCAPESSVVTVLTDDGTLYALVATGARPDHWAASTDGGQSWTDSDMPADAPEPSLPLNTYEDPGSIGMQEVCATDGTCWSLRDRRSIERVAPEGETVTEFHLTDADFDHISTGCAGSGKGVLATIAVVNVGARSTPVASLGADGVVVRQVDGTWDRVRVLSARPERPKQGLPAAPAFLLLAPVLAAIVWLTGRHRSWRSGLSTVAAGWFATLVAAGTISFLAGPDADTSGRSGVIAIVGSVITAVAAIAASRRPARVAPAVYSPSPTRPPPPYPPPPPPPPA